MWLTRSGKEVVYLDWYLGASRTLARCSLCLLIPPLVILPQRLHTTLFRWGGACQYPYFHPGSFDRSGFRAWSFIEPWLGSSPHQPLHLQPCCYTSTAANNQTQRNISITDKRAAMATRQQTIKYLLDRQKGTRHMKRLLWQQLNYSTHADVANSDNQLAIKLISIQLVINSNPPNRPTACIILFNQGASTKALTPLSLN